MPPPKQQRPPQQSPQGKQPPPQSEEPPKEIIEDKFQKFKRDPRLETRFVKEQRPVQTKPSPNKAALLSSTANTVSQLKSEFGLPSFLSSYKQIQEVSWALLTPEESVHAKDGTTPISDFSVVFSNKGETYGRKTLDNRLFFEKAFPQHNVWAYDDFIDHHMNHAADSERLTLLDTQVLSTDTSFFSVLDQQIARLIFERPLSTEFEQKLTQQRQAILTQYPTLNFSNTSEGWNDFLFLIHSTQLLNGRVFPQLRQRSISSVLSALTPLTIFSSDQLLQIKQLYTAMHAVVQNGEHKT